MKIKFLITLIFACVFFSCCKKDADSTDEEITDTMEFEKEQYDITSGSSCDCKVLNADSCSFTVINETIANILSSRANECRVEGIKAGATVIKAVNGNEESRAIINVTKNDTARNAWKNKEWFICSFAYETEDSIQLVETFFTQGVPEIEINEKYICVKKGNGKYIYCEKEKFMYFDYEIYRG